MNPVNINSALAVEQPPLTAVEKIALEEMTETVSQIVTRVLQTMLISTKWTPQEIVETHVVPKQKELAALDRRTNEFFLRIMKIIDGRVIQVPTIVKAFTKLVTATKDAEIREKIIKGVAYPYIKQLVAKLDAIQPSIVNDVIALKEITETTETIIQEICMIIADYLNFAKFDSQQFVSTYVTPKQDPLAKLDLRMNEFFLKMIDAINQRINREANRFEVNPLKLLLSAIKNDRETYEKFIKGIAYPHIQQLVTNLDAIHPSIVDDIIAG